MNPILQNVIALLAGAVFGSIVNMGIIMVSGHIIPPPTGADVTTMEGLKSSLHLFEPKHFILPFLAHALGTFAGALLTAKVSFNHKVKLAMGIGFLFLVGGIANTMMLPSPLWFTVLDLVGAYLPMGYLAGTLLRK
ncbi:MULTISPECIES: hypothetical protein [Leptospira]|uniref:Uncharacterized protein n=2 Tax=Leptospira kirschneri TaxID=29507 RepID=A0A828Y467_9LEPT|nr:MULTISPECIES: hypothetical protein [Leptospira]EMO75018.1 hypothetical protein LEP1GSC127_0383 [Leptospira kirschneri str. 200801925]EKO49721.1 hypothetical protein LEP1GSC131_0081 [Leptospira kirschneri str. 200802841]EKO60034.1 hypothetical protein LEP1GSC082_3646 [Leptospira kirschneri str. H2]EKP06985.1 hypothetical protein LEP1GSC018_1267 [Leptospira kirschneri str. 2008720114]EMJ86168.1 hypothetical protein LEP1GSC198_3463 [Leptospira kirschneri str. JB]